MKIKFRELSPGNCFKRGKKGRPQKKIDDGRVLTSTPKGKQRSRKVKGNPSIEPVSCPLPFLGAGLRNTPDGIVEIG